MIYIIVLLILLLIVNVLFLIVIFGKSKRERDEQRFLLQELQRLMKESREEFVSSLTGFSGIINQNLKNFQDSTLNSSLLSGNLQRERLDQIEKRQNEMIANTEKRLEQIRTTVEEKLEKTLSDRLGKSFETVGKQLIEVQKGLGEMQTLAQDVGGLKRVLSNVKMRGGIGEVQLSMLLENILAPDQYESNVKTRSSGRDFVEFAVKLPGKDESRKHIWLPVDAKFPKEYYESLQNAYDSGDLTLIEREQRNLENAIRVMAKDISSKYIEPPATTDFAIMFLPFEGIYAEVVRKASLLEEVQSRYKVLITGPTTFAAILNSLQMGFRTLAIEKRSGEVWSILGAVKREFSTFGDLLNKAQKSIQGGLDDIDKLVGVRTRVIQRRLSNVEGMNPANESNVLAGSGFSDSDSDSDSDAGFTDE